MADNSGDIYVEFDYQNIIMVDPNKTISNGNVRDRLVDHENLVMYANLEAQVIPRTKLSVGGAPGDRITTLSVAKMNFLRPTEGKSLTSGYYDELTGLGSKEGTAVNQLKKEYIKPIDGTKPYVKQSLASGGEPEDTGLLGITSINVSTSTSFIPSVRMTLEDIQGRALFQLGNSSPYSAFFNLPYCPFYLTLKGYYGQAIRYQLNLKTFNARFNTFSGNYQIDLEFVGYKFNILNEISMGSLLATPHMYSKRFNISKSITSPEGGANKTIESQSKSNKISKESTISKDVATTELVTEKGYQKILEVYSEYKAKGLISPNFPELTLLQLMNKLDQFEISVVEKYTKADVEPLTNIRAYIETLSNFYGEVYGNQKSWFNVYLNSKPIILNGNDAEVYVFKKEFYENSLKKNEAKTNLERIISSYSKLLGDNPTLGNGSKTPIKNSITYNTMLKTVNVSSDINLVKTTTSQTEIVSPTEVDIQSITKLINAAFIPFNEQEASNTNVGFGSNIIIPPAFYFETFKKNIDKMQSIAITKLSEYETILTDNLAKKIEESVGFSPTVRNICSVIMASAEAFIRLLDEVHTKAWDVKYDKIRQLAILDNPSSAPGTDKVDYYVISESAQNSNQGLVNGIPPVYPWPQFFVETPDNKKGRFQLKYIADPSVVNLTKGFLYEKWPEVEFVEEYMRGLTMKFNQPISQPPSESQNTTNIINFNAIEYPSQGIAYLNKQEIKFFYEIWERQFLTSNYSGFIRGNDNQINQMNNLIVSAETNNIVTSLGVSSPFLSLKLKNSTTNSQNYVSFLSSISNQGTGRSYQEFIRDFYVTPYIKNLTSNSFNILNVNDIGREPQTGINSSELLQLVKNVSNEPLIVDTYPFTDQTWVSNNMANSDTNTKNSVYDTNRVLTVFEERDVVSNFNNINDYTKNRPVTNFSYLKVTNPTPEVSTIGIPSFYNLRKDPKTFIPTEGFVNYFSEAKLVNVEATTSILNTPYFVNAIQNGVFNWRKNDPYPYVQAAYLFINSLPIASLKEKYKSLDSPTDLDYIASCFKKFSAIHKMPYAWILKMGSVWHRYKTYKNTNVDILDSAWKNFNYTENFDPITKTTNKTYSFKFEGDKNITLQNVADNNVNIQTGFFPKVINDFNVFYNGYDLYVKYDNNEIQQSINNGVQVFNFSQSNVQTSRVVASTTRYENIETWSVILPNGLGDDITPGAVCNPSDNTKPTKYYIVPSFGTQFNQVKSECFNLTNQPICEFLDNPSIYNGSVRLLWSSSNYGYFNTTNVVKPSPESYLNKINTGTTQQSPFNILLNDEYSRIEEIFSVFNKDILDRFEKEFLNFCKPIANIDLGEDVVVPIDTSPVDQNAIFKNFQYLFRNLMEINPKTSSNNTEQYFNTIGQTQLNVFANSIKAFLEYDVILKYGNPMNYDRRVFDSYLAQSGLSPIVDPIKFKSYVPNSLPSVSNTISLAVSKSINPKAWNALELNVGFSTIRNLVYTDRGSYITDFFIDNNIEFSETNVILLTPIIKMYATQKLLTPSLNGVEFKNRLQLYLARTTQFQNNILNLILTRVRGVLPEQQELPERVIKSTIDGEQSKVEFYEVFKALNDKWVAGSDYTNKTLFEDFMFLDRASRNIGDIILLDIFDLQDIINESSLNMEMSVFTFISGLLIKNKFNVMPLPAYVNFYNIQDVDATATPKIEGQLDFANNMWGTFLNVDYRNSSPKMVCFYAGQPSIHLDLPKGNSRYRDDAFDLRRTSDNPLLDDWDGKTDWSISNRCVGFNVDYGVKNQNVFNSVQVSMDGGKATSETIQTNLNMVNQATGRDVATQNVSLYNLYKQRSYQCQVQCLGNALLQPTMYFNLRHVPMFNGPYFITDVSHTITPGNFETTFSGVRQGIFDLPSIDKFLQSINQNLLSQIESIVKNKKDSVTQKLKTKIDDSTLIVQNSNSSAAAQNSCINNLLSVYAEWADIQPSTSTSVTITDFVEKLKNKTQNVELQLVIYSICYVSSFRGGKFYGYNNNYANIVLTRNYGGSSDYFVNRKCSCVNIPSTGSETSQPMAIFESIDKFIDFMIIRLARGVGRIFGTTGLGIEKFYACNWPTENFKPEQYDSTLSQYKDLRENFNKAYTSAGASGLNVSLSKEQKAKSASQTNVNKLPTPTANNLNVTTNVVPSCPPPILTSFSPLSGVSGTIITIRGENLNTVTGITINEVFTTTGITILNNFTLSVITPYSNTSIPQKKPIILSGLHGSSATLNYYTYNPAQITPVTSNVNNTNAQPQQIGPVVMEGKTQVVNNATINLSVNINPQASVNNVWIMNPKVKMFVSVYDNNVVNNVNTQTLNRSVTTTITGYVSNNTFTMTNTDVENILIKNPIDEFKPVPVSYGQTVRLKFEITSTPTDKTKNPQDVSQTFEFNFIPPSPINAPASVVSSLLNNQPGTLIKVYESNDVNLPDYNGSSYYNIKKPAGGYITYRFECSNLLTTSPPRVIALPNMTDATIVVTNTPDTKYTNVIEVKTLGRFELKISYTSDDLKLPIPNSSTTQLITGTVTSLPFTL